MRDYRDDFPRFAPTIYLDCAYQGPFPKAAVAAIEKAIELKCHPERLLEHEYTALPERVRGQLASLVGADPSEIALTNSATQGIGIVVSGLDFKPGDEVVVAGSNFPSNLFTWLHLRRRGVEVRVMRPASEYATPDEVRAVLTPRTRILALDWVGYSTGARIDLAALGELAHRQGALFVVDGTQGVGSLELNLHDLPVDAMACAGYKWLLGPYGSGFAYLKSDIQERLDLQVVNWLSVEGSEEFDALPIEQFTLSKGARIFDLPETGNFLNFYALEASLAFVERAGVRTVTQHCAHLIDRLAEGLRQQGYRLSAAIEPEHRSAILGFQADSLAATAKLHEKLRANNIAVSLRHGMIRVSPYLYNTHEDVERLVSLVSCRER